MSSLLELLKQRYLTTLRSVDSRWKILIVDQHTQKMLNSVLSTYDVLEEGVQQVDLITSQRTAQPRLAAIYLLMPTSQNVDLILRDHSPNPPPSTSSHSKSSSSRKNREPQSPPPNQIEGPKYAAAHLHFVDGIDDGLVGKLTAGLPANYLQALTELYVNFHALEPRTFSLQSPQTFFTLYAPPERSPKESLQVWEDEIGWMSKSIVNALATLGEYPLIRYYDPPSSFHAPLGPALASGAHIAKRLAERVQKDIDLYARDNTDFPPMPDPPRPRGILFITDRSMDLNAPLLHEFTYQAMCNDLLDIEDGIKYKYSFRNQSGALEDKEAILSNDDKVWTEVRHMHMKDALDKLIGDFKAYAGEHGDKFGGGGGGTSLNDMKDMLASLPQLREAKDKLSLHLTMAEKCMALFESKKLPLSASVEQCCATGVTPEGKTPKTLVEEMVPLLDDRSVSSVDKVRIIALYIMHRDGVPEGDKKRLYQHARLALHEMDAVNNLMYLGVNVSKDSGKKRKPLFKQQEEEDSYDISRYQPALKTMLEEHFNNKLDQSIFPYVRDAPVSAGRGGASAAAGGVAPGSLRSARPQWTGSRSKKPVNEPRQRVLVFVAGGVTYSEVRAVYKASEAFGKDVFIGSTNILTPAQFVKDLSNLDQGGGASMSSSHHPSTQFQAVKENSSKAPPRPAAVSQSAVDRRFGSSPPTSPPQQGFDPRASFASIQSSSSKLSKQPPSNYSNQYQQEPTRQQYQPSSQSRPPPSNNSSYNSGSAYGRESQTQTSSSNGGAYNGGYNQNGGQQQQYSNGGGGGGTGSSAGPPPTQEKKKKKLFGF